MVISQKIKNWFPVVLICLLGAVVYANTLHEAFHFDDHQFILGNPAIRDISNVSGLWNMLSQPSRFVAFYSFALNYHVHQYDAFWYHVTNLVIHLTTAVLVWWLVGMLVKRGNRTQTSGVCMGLNPYKPPRFVYGSSVALFVALIFVAHPLQTQAVTYITQRFASLATMFYLLSLCFYIKGRGVETRLPAGKAGLIASVHFLGAAIAAVLGMFTKEIVITLPLMILLIEYFFLKAKRRYVIPILLFCLIVPAVFSFNIKGVVFGQKMSESHYGDVITFGKYVMTQFRVMTTFIKLTLFPIGQNADYDFPLSQTFFEGSTFLSFVFLLGIMGWLIFWLRKRNMLAAFGLFWFFIALAPNFIPRRHVIFEHKLYLAMVGAALFMCGGMFQIFKNPKKCMVTISLIIVTLSYLTFQRNQVWRNEINLWEDVVHKSPNKARAHNNLGSAYFQGNEYSLAFKHYDRALSLNPYYAQAYTNRGVVHEKKRRYDLALVDHNQALKLKPNYAEAYSNRGVVYDQMGQYDLALADFNHALELTPDSIKIFNNRGNIFRQRGQYDLALKDYQKALASRSGLEEVYNNIGIIYEKKGRFDLALQEYEKTLAINPNYAKAYGNRGIVYGKQGKFDKALTDYQKALAFDPDDKSSYSNRGLVYEKMGQLDLALADYNKALELDSGFETVYYNRGIVYGKKRQYDLALADYTQAIALNPNYAQAYSNRGTAYVEKKEYEAALADYAKALEINPDFLEVYYNKGIVFINLEKYPEALKSFEKVLELKPGFVPAEQQRLKIWELMHD